MEQKLWLGHHICGCWEKLMGAILASRAFFYDLANEVSSICLALITLHSMMYRTGIRYWKQIDKTGVDNESTTYIVEPIDWIQLWKAKIIFINTAEHDLSGVTSSFPKCVETGVTSDPATNSNQCQIVTNAPIYARHKCNPLHCNQSNFIHILLLIHTSMERALQIHNSKPPIQINPHLD